MNALTAALRELWGLFVEDWTFTLAIVLCLVLAMFLAPALGLSPKWRGGALFVLLAVALLENVWRSARA